MFNGADVSVGKYIAQSMIPSFIGNGELIPSLRDERALIIVIGGCLRESPVAFRICLTSQWASQWFFSGIRLSCHSTARALGEGASQL